MEEWIVYMMNTYGYIGILILIAVENIFPPIPSEVILTFSGFLTTTSDVKMTGVIIFSTIGSMIGAVILYGIGRLLDVKKLEIIVDRWGYLLRLTRKDIKKADEWFARVGIWAVLIGRVVPIVRSLISIPAGMAKMNLGVFLLFTALGSLIWNSVLVYIGARVGSSWGKIVSYIDTYSNLVVLLLSFLILFFIVRLFWRRRNA